MRCSIYPRFDSLLLLLIPFGARTGNGESRLEGDPSFESHDEAGTMANRKSASATNQKSLERVPFFPRHFHLHNSLPFSVTLSSLYPNS
jgi:hypothetical protein